MNPNQNPVQPTMQPIAPSAPNDIVTPSIQPPTPSPVPTPNSVPAFDSAPVQPAPYGPEPVMAREPMPTTTPAQPQEPLTIAPADQALAQPTDAFAPVAPVAPIAASPIPSTDENPAKGYVVAFVLSYFLGLLGADRFYLRKYGTGVLKLVTLGGFGIWALVDMVRIAFGKVTARGDSRPLRGYGDNHHGLKIASIVLVVLSIVLSGVGYSLMAASVQDDTFVKQYETKKD